ncbi:MAG TPA: DinB family protein [Rhodothermales bacterium]
MNADWARTLIAYDDWANDRTVSTIRNLSDEQFLRPLGGSFSSIRDTFAHIVSGEWIWHRRLLGEIPREMPAWVGEAGLDELVNRLEVIAHERRRHFETITDAQIAATVHFAYLSGAPASLTCGQIVAHLVNHSSYHRGQVATYVRQVGAVPAGTDLAAFLAQPPRG